MEKSDSEKTTSGSNTCDETSQLNRNRSFKSKQLVRSQAIRESTSPPRTISPGNAITDNESAQAIVVNNLSSNVTKNVACNVTNNETRTIRGNNNVTSDTSSHVSDDRYSDVISYSDNKNSDFNDEFKKKQPVEIQITPGSWDAEAHTEQRQRTKRWLGYRHHSDSSRDLLSNIPRVACVCGSCAACPHCRGRRRKHACPTKQDSGIVCSDDCPDCSDSEQTGGPSGDGSRKCGSLDVDEQTAYYCRCPDRTKPKSISLSRTDSEEKTEPTGVDLVNFIKETLNKNARDRMTLFKIEKELHSLVTDTGRCIVRFPVMTSYGRMLVHRCAALFQLSHHLDQSNKNCVLVSKSGTSGGRLPCTSFKQWCIVPFPPSPQRHQSDLMHAKSILKRDAHSLEEEAAGARAAARSKSLEQREREYERVRRRIFSTDNCAQDESQWPWLTTGPVKLLTPEASRNKLIKVHSLEASGVQQVNRGRGAVSKSHSFGGYAGSEQQPRLLSRQGDLASSSWRLSPSSSGYKTLSLRSTDSVTPSPTGGASPEPSATEGAAVVWAVTDLSSVPPGAIVIHPQTGRPLTNADGTVYHFDPANPPVLYDPNVYVQTDQQKAENSCEKRRGRLEKQNSFIDNEGESVPSEEYHVKCCCECRRQDKSPQRSPPDKIPVKMEQKSTPEPTSPNKKRYDSNTETRANNTPPDITTNHKSPYDATANQKTPPDTNQKAAYDVHEIQKSVYETSANKRTEFEPSSSRQNSESTNPRTFENQKSASFDNQKSAQFENQRPASFENVANQKPYDSNNPARPSSDVITNQRVIANKLTTQESQEMPQYLVQQNFVQTIRSDEITSPQAMNPAFIQADMNIHNMMVQAKLTPVHMQDPNMRPISLNNMVYQTQVAQSYPFVNQCRMDQSLQPAVYQQLVQQTDEHKHLAPSTQNPHNAESTFRIDPSYPYLPADVGPACGACTGNCPESGTLQTQPRSYNVSYGQVEVPQQVLQPTYPVGNVMLPQPQMQPYPQYQEPIQWPHIQAIAPTPPKLYVHELYPVVQYPSVYPQYNVMYPQVIPQPYPICQPIYPIVDKQETRRNSLTNHRLSKRNSISGSARNTPLQTPPDDKKVPYNENLGQNPGKNIEKNVLSRQNSNEIAARIQQIKDQMAQLSTREKDRDSKPFRGRGAEDWKRRNSGSGLLGSYPANNYNGRATGRPMNDEAQLNSAARAIVNSIRSMQVKATYNDRRCDEQRNSQYQRNENQRQERQDYRNRHRQDRDIDNKPVDHCQDRTNDDGPKDRPKNSGRCDDSSGNQERNRNDVNRNRSVNPVQFQYRPPYLLRQMSPGNWCRRSPGPAHPVLNNPRRPHPDPRHGRR